MLAALRAGNAEAIAARLYNNMTGPAVGLAAEVGEAVALLQAADGVLGCAVAGSGSTVFGVFGGDASANAAVRTARERGWWARVTHTIDRGVSVRAERGDEEASG
jgi:4-diphosphocytidyl-2C-methyl-D-erythritol kinase